MVKVSGGELSGPHPTEPEAMEAAAGLALSSRCKVYILETTKYCLVFPMPEWFDV